MSPDAQYCFDLVRAHDRDRFLSVLFAPEEMQPRLMALYAFNVEIARIAGTVSEAQLGLIRQQWWLDTLDAIFRGEAVDHPVARELARSRIPVDPLRGLVRAREFDLYDDQMPDLVSLEGHLGETASVLIQLAAMVLAEGEAARAAEAAGLAGVAAAMAGVLAGGPGARKFLPKDWLEAEGETGARQKLAVQARRRLAEARALLPEIPEAALPAFLPVSLSGLYLRPRPPSQFRRQLTLWWAARRNRF